MRKLSELLNDLEVLDKQRVIVETWEDSDIKEVTLTDINLAMDCLDCCLMCGDYINDTGKEFDYYNM